MKAKIAVGTWVFFGWRICERSFLFVCVVMCKMIDFSTRIENAVCFDSLYRYVRFLLEYYFNSRPHITYCFSFNWFACHSPFFASKTIHSFIFRADVISSMTTYSVAGFYSFFPGVCVFVMKQVDLCLLLDINSMY